ncbi:hypothetical protein HPC50_12230 [Corallococcus exiguus]|uniref:hypothetical protein n=1 Tax=Corallococcus TaxID=83461 RepID=UPI0011C40340|nr:MULTISPECIES: hypothetical protein [Corallococcus]NNB87769.1 hypothetical protein [Corallococcus exiguus]NPC47841.1 hypothetical protein [Corallococcus exiguus]
MRLTATITSPTKKSMGETVASLEIAIEEGALYLFRQGVNGEPLGDTWHQSIEEAMRQAKFEFQ